MDDIPFIDSLQKQNSKQLGFFRRAQMEGYIRNGWGVIAEAQDERREKRDERDAESPSLISHLSSRIPVGYCFSRDRYQKRDELGVIYQLCVVKGVQRKLVGASLIKHVFENASYGCRLYCCWCAQDLEANYFWESLGFVPIAFRAGSRGKRRVHIFWEKRIREGDTTTQYWFPSETGGGAIGEDRLVFPIPPGVHWSDAKPIVLPEHTHVNALPEPATPKPSTKRAKQPPMPTRVTIGTGTTWFSGTEQAKPTPKAKAPRVPKQKVKNDPRYKAAARELRDRYLEQYNSGSYLPEPTAQKYHVCRMIEATKTRMLDESPAGLLPAPMAA